MTTQALEPRKTSFWTRVIAGAPTRPTRFHDQDGKAVPFGRILRNGPHALYTAIVRVLTGSLPKMPWLAYDAHPILAAHLTPQSSVLEFGSGMSTKWLAERCGKVMSFEDVPDWYERVRSELPAGDKFRFILGLNPADYTAVPEGEEFDLILVDGRWRDTCVEVGLKHLRSGGILYLDNTDKLPDDHVGDMPRAVAMMKDAAKTNGWQLTEITDFAPGLFFVQSALLLKRS